MINQITKFTNKKNNPTNQTQPVFTNQSNTNIIKYSPMWKSYLRLERERKKHEQA